MTGSGLRTNRHSGSRSVPATHYITIDWHDGYWTSIKWQSSVPTPDVLLQSSTQAADVHSHSPPYTIAGVEEHHSLTTTLIQSQESAPQSSTIISRAETRCTSSLSSFPAITVEPRLQPTPTPEPEMDPHSRSSPSVQIPGQSMTSTTSPGKSMSPVVTLHRDPTLDTINRDRNFREIEKKMEIHSDSWTHF